MSSKCKDHSDDAHDGEVIESTTEVGHNHDRENDSHSDESDSETHADEHDHEE
ncbi:hypothetical protein KC878_02345 [Candidatus Saccharibacteria bacterium]|nr:hypothetical protein [Candidatus Saccharibacteria bacterium]MCB9821083.1 hypothetical protein [Candidatus Nomurabacteria bacterium]